MNIEDVRTAADAAPDAARSATSEVALQLADLAADLAADAPTDAALQRALKRAIDLVPGCEQAGMSLVLKGAGLTTPASVGPLAEACDRLQHRLGEGPCITSLTEHTTVRIDDLQADGTHPRFTDAATELGVRSVLACWLATDRNKVGALNLYSTRPAAFDDEAVRVAHAYATHIGVALAAAEREANLNVALTSREIIGQAIGILIERHKLTASGAFDLMVHISQRTHVRLREIAENLVRTGVLPE